MFRYVILNCTIAASDHIKSKRQYAHVLHEDGVICVAPSFWGLPDGHLFGILAHEVGHLIANHNNPNHTEAEADGAFASIYGYEIDYKSGVHGQNLQWLPQAQRRQFIREFNISLDEGWISHPRLLPPVTMKSRRSR